MSTPPFSMSFASGSATVTDGNGYTYTASYVTLEPGDAVGMQMSADGFWLTVERDGEVQRHPLRRGDDPHYTELTTMTWPPNPFLPSQPTDTEGETKS